jgi:3-O-methylgallate 3,4-dioxygenase
MPAILIYTGETIANNPLHLDEDAPEFWRRARAQYHEEGGVREYPVASKLALHMVDHLMDQGFDISHSKRLGKDIGEGHAFGFVHRRIMKESVIPVVPVAINTYARPTSRGRGAAISSARKSARRSRARPATSASAFSVMAA